jgi:hypothetical protein
MYNPKYIINRSLDNNEIQYPPMHYNGKEVSIKLLRLTQVFPIDLFSQFDEHDINRRIVYWTNDNVDDILFNLSKPKSRDMYYTYDTRPRPNPFVNPFESNINCEKRKIETDHFDHYNFYNCHPYKYVYLLEFDNTVDTNNFLDEHLDVNITLPHLEEYNPYEFIYIITILGRRMNFFNMHISSTITYRIYDKLIENFKPIINDAFTRFSEETLTLLNRPHKHIYNTNLYNYLYSDSAPNLCYNLFGDHNYIWLGLMDNSKIKLSDVKIQLIIKEEYIFWVIHKLLINLDRIISNNIVAFKFFFQNGKYLGNYASKFPNEPDTVTSQFENYMFNGKEYKREIVSPPTVVFYIANGVNIKNIIDLLYELLPDSENLNHKKISNGVMPRFNFRVTENICISVGGDNQNKNNIRQAAFHQIYNDTNIPSEYTEIINIAKRYVLNQEQCNLFNKYTNNISGHDLLKYEDGQCSVNNILSYKGIIGNKGSFLNVFQQLNLLDYYEKLYNTPEFNMFKQNVIETSPTKPLSAGYKINKINKNKKLSKRLSDKQKKYMSKKHKKTVTKYY